MIVKSVFNTLRTCYIFDCYSVPSSSKYLVNNIPLFFFLGLHIQNVFLQKDEVKPLQRAAMFHS